ncbi:FtsX-like permease family protein, partial [Escherichia coli]
TVMLGLLAIAGVVIALTAVSLVAVLTSIVRILVELRRPTFALWLIVGLTPRQVSTVLLAELAVVSTVSLAVGSAVAIAVAPPLLTALLSASPGLE